MRAPFSELSVTFYFSKQINQEKGYILKKLLYLLICILKIILVEDSIIIAHLICFAQGTKTTCKGKSEYVILVS